MTREEILALKPGRELDSIIADKVMGYIHFVGSDIPIGVPLHRGKEPGQVDEVWLKSITNFYCRWCGNLPSYSTDIAAAWAVVELMHNRNRFIRVADQEDHFKCGFFHPYTEDKTNFIKADTAPEAICKAALLAVI